MGYRTLIAFIVLSVSVAALVLPPDGRAYKRSPLRGRGGQITVEVAWGTWTLDGPMFRPPELTIGRASSRVMQQQICVLRRVWRYAGGAYEPLRGWKVDWTDFRCGTGTSVRYPALWIPRYFDAVHFDIVVTWRNPSNRKIIAKERVEWDQVSNYGCLKPGPEGNCHAGLLFRGVAGISFSL